MSFDTDEKILISQLRDGSEEAFSKIYKTYKQPVYRYCLLLTKQEDIAHEIGQQIFISLWINHSKVNPESPFSSYLFTIAINKIRNHFRDIARNAEMRNDWLLTNELVEDTIEKELVKKENMDSLYNAIENLPSRKQCIFKLGRLEGKSYEEISITLGISKNTVKNHLVEATKLVKQFVLANSHLLFSLFLASSLLCNN